MSGNPTLERIARGNALALCAAGSWTARFAPVLERMVADAEKLGGTGPNIFIDVSQVSKLDTFGGWLPPLTGNEDMQSFPSGHTATAVGLAIALTMLYPRGWWLFGILAILAATQRIDSQAHYLSDVLAGAAISFLVAAIVTAPTPLARWLAHVEQQNTRASFGPRPDA